MDLLIILLFWPLTVIQGSRFLETCVVHAHTSLEPCTPTPSFRHLFLISLE